MRIKKFLATTAILAIIFVSMVLAIGVAPVTASAETTATEQENVTAVEESGRVHTLLTRAQEWFENNFLEFIGSADLLTALGLVVTVILETKSNKKHKADISTAISSNAATTKANTASNDKVLEVVNELIEMQNKHEEKEVLRDDSSNQIAVLQRAILEILVSVYVNNKNLPQATKDLVQMKYVNAIKENSEKPNMTEE